MSRVLLCICEGIWVNMCLLKTFFGKQRINARGILGSLDSGFEFSFVTHSRDLVPIYVSEKWMSLNLFGIWKRTKSLFRISLQKFAEKVTSIGLEIWSHWNRLFDDISKHLLSISVVMWRSTAQHFVKESAKTPPIGTSSMSSTFDNFWSEILWGTTETVGLIIFANILLR